MTQILWIWVPWPNRLRRPSFKRKSAGSSPAGSKWKLVPNSLRELGITIC